jgi:hypothetical protein
VPPGRYAVHPPATPDYAATIAWAAVAGLGLLGVLALLLYRFWRIRSDMRAESAKTEVGA